MRKNIIENVRKLGYKVNNLVCKVNDQLQTKGEWESLVCDISTVKLELKAYFMSLITGTRLKVDFIIEDRLNERLSGYVIKAKALVLITNKEFHRWSFVLNAIFLRVKFLFLKLNSMSIVMDDIRVELDNIISNLNFILFHVSELYNIIYTLNTLILLSLKNQDKELYEEVNVKIINLRVLLDQIAIELQIIYEVNLKWGVKKINLVSLNTSNILNITEFVSDERNKIFENEQANELNLLTSFRNQVKNLIFPLKILKNDIDLVSYMSDIFWQLDYIQSEVNSELQKELYDIVNNNIIEMFENLNLYMISKLKGQVKCIYVNNMGYTFKEFKIYITGLINDEDFVWLGEQASKLEDFALLHKFCLNLNKNLRFYLDYPLKNKNTINDYDILFTNLQDILDNLKIGKILEIKRLLHRGKRKTFRREKLKKTKVSLINEVNVEKEKKKELKAYIVSPLGKINNTKIDVDVLLNEVKVYLISPLKTLKEELQVFMLFLVRTTVTELVFRLERFKEIQEIVIAEGEDVFISILELNYRNKFIRARDKEGIKNVIINIKKEIHDLFFPMDVQENVNEDVKLFFAKIQAYKRVKKRLREVAKEEFAEFYERSKSKHEIKDIIFKVYHLYNQLEELEIILLYLILIKFSGLRDNIQICLEKKK